MAGLFDEDARMATWPSGKAEACKAFTPGSNPGVASKNPSNAFGRFLFVRSENADALGLLRYAVEHRLDQPIWFRTVKLQMVSWEEIVDRTLEAGV